MGAPRRYVRTHSHPGKLAHPNSAGIQAPKLQPFHALPYLPFVLAVYLYPLLTTTKYRNFFESWESSSNLIKLQEWVLGIPLIVSGQKHRWKNLCPQLACEVREGGSHGDPSPQSVGCDAIYRVCMKLDYRTLRQCSAKLTGCWLVRKNPSPFWSHRTGMC